MDVFEQYQKQTTKEDLSAACENIVFYLRFLITDQKEQCQNPLVDIVLLSHLANVSTDCGAIVMLAFDQIQTRFVVVKEYLHEDGAWQLPAHVVRQLQSSCKIHSSHFHPKCLQPCIDIQITENRTHLIFPYYPLTFDALFGLNRKPPSSFVMEKAIELLHAVQTLHDIGIAHRDIKGPNICVDERGRLILIDFDSSIAENLTHRKTVPVCTLQTRAPEQIRAELVPDVKNSYDAKAGDWWAVGCVIAQMFLGNSLFHVRATTQLKEYYEYICMFCAQLGQWKTSTHDVVKALRRCVGNDTMVLLVGLLSLDPSKRHQEIVGFLFKQLTLS